jgi:hypothetical protein
MKHRLHMITIINNILQKVKEKCINNDRDLQTCFQTFKKATLGLLGRTLHLIAVKIWIPIFRLKLQNLGEAVSSLMHCDMYVYHVPHAMGLRTSRPLT